VIGALTELRAIVVPMIGVDRIDVPAATRSGVVVANSPTVQNQVSVAEAAIGLILMLLKRVKHNEALLRAGGWGKREDRGDLLMGKTVGIIGLGQTGSNVARRLAGWDVDLIGCDAYVPDSHAAALNVTRVDLDTLLARSDVVTLHASLTPETRGLIGETQLRKMKPSAVLVNLARGEMVDERALARALTGKWIAAAALDAFEPEPLPMDSALRGLDEERLVLTPHNVSHTDAARRAGVALAVAQILAVGRGEAPVNSINREVLPNWRGAASPRS
jgi:D-3-phosphoglycerate dehydrogenase